MDPPQAVGDGGLVNEPPPGYWGSQSEALETKDPTQSPLCRLPDHLLLRIMEYVGEPGIFCLRRTSRVFMRLFGDDRFSLLHDELKNRRIHSTRLPPWPWKIERVRLTETRGELRELLHRDFYCTFCRCIDRADVKERLANEVLYCSGCQMEHPAGQFSYKQRRRVPDNNRICIGREGSVRLCDHWVVTLKDIEKYLAGDALCVDRRCSKPSHNSGRHAGHGRTYLQFISSINRTLLCDTNHGHRPAVRLIWETHISVPGLGLNNRVDGEELLKKIRQHRQSGPPNITTKFPGKVPPEMQVFDCKSCSCLATKADSGIGHSDTVHHGRPSVCTLHRTRDNDDCEDWVFTNFFFRTYWEEQASERCPDENGRTLWTVEKCKSSTQTECIRVWTEQNVPLLPCQNRDPLDLEAFNLATSESWYLALDPASYNLELDGESYGIYWCRTRSCRNYLYSYRTNRTFAALGARDLENRREKKKKSHDTSGVLDTPSRTESVQGEINEPSEVPNTSPKTESV